MTYNAFPNQVFSAGVDTYSGYPPESKVKPVYIQFQEAIKKAEELECTHYTQLYWPGSIQTLHFFKDDIPEIADSIEGLRVKARAPEICDYCGK